MKSLRVAFRLMVPLIALSLLPSLGWSTRAYGDLVSGEITASPGNGQIEVAHRAYHVRPNSAADHIVAQFETGQVVDMVLDGPVNDPQSQVISIVRHAGQ